MNIIMIKRYIRRVVIFLCTAFIAFALTACDSTLRFTVIKQGGVTKGARFSYFCNLPIDKDDIDVKEIKQSLLDSGVKSVHIKRNKDGLLIEGSFGMDGNPFTQSGVVAWSDGGKLEVIFTRKTLRALYDKLSADIDALIDILMPPVTGDEEMSDEEYLDAIGALYGDDLKKNIEQGVLKIFIGDDKSVISILKVLNAK